MAVSNVGGRLKKVKGFGATEFADFKEVTNAVHFKETSSPSKKKPVEKLAPHHHTVKKDTDTDVRHHIGKKDTDTDAPLWIRSGRVKRKKGLLWPGHNHLGPGNDLENGPTQSHADNVAKEHDYAYAHAWTPEHIKEADARARAQFMKTPYQISSLAGYVGLGVKSLAESAFGPIYPTRSDLYSRLMERSAMVSVKRKRYGPY
ncbi:VP1 [Bactericera trigonica densovirus]|uniref:VP1 n=1 Tax=Bactericera trigonica densovirus TaxID=3070179 RepID=A0A5C1K345_9VIRU|nr:VP1 [Bactericera trigonica densovirus]QEM39035.1 VP1 [Bactericera trigonica densovirus]